MAMGYVSTGMGDSLGALLVSLMALQLILAIRDTSSVPIDNKINCFLILIFPQNSPNLEETLCAHQI